MFDKVNEVIINQVRPHLKDHYGDIELLNVKDGIVEVRLLGACHGCPSAKITIEEVVETILRDQVPEVEKVMLVNDVSQELLDMAKKILHRER